MQDRWSPTQGAVMCRLSTIASFLLLLGCGQSTTEPVYVADLTSSVTSEESWNTPQPMYSEAVWKSLSQVEREKATLRIVRERLHRDITSVDVAIDYLKGCGFDEYLQFEFETLGGGFRETTATTIRLIRDSPRRAEILRLIAPGEEPTYILEQAKKCSPELWNKIAMQIAGVESNRVVTLQSAQELFSSLKYSYHRARLVRGATQDHQACTKFCHLDLMPDDVKIRLLETAHSLGRGRRFDEVSILQPGGFLEFLIQEAN